MKMSKILALVLAALMLVACFAACTPKTPEQNNGEDLSGTYNITMWVSEKEGVADQFKAQIDAFEAANPGIIINAEIEGVTEADAGSKVIADVATAPDIYCFAQDQLARLVQASALLAPGKNAAATITANNDKGSVGAASVGGTIYAYPMTSDNGYYMYYDTSIISAEEAESLEDLIKACEENGKKFRFALENAWYTAAFFFATGCHSNWTTNEAGEFVSCDDTFASANGLIAMKGMEKLAKSPAYDSNADIFTDAGVIVTGIWNAEAADVHFGENLGVTDLPSFTVDGKSYHLGSYSGNKLMGVKPQTDAKRGAVLSLLAQYLTGEACQKQRFDSFQWGPSNLAVQASDAVQANASLAALAKQNAYATAQGNIAGVFWDTAKLLGAVAKNATNEAELQKGLDDYKAACDKFVSLTPEQRSSFTVIGAVKGTTWDTDFEMKEDPKGTWTTKEAFTFAGGEEFKVRLGMDWKTAYGDNTANADKSIPLSDKPNYKVAEAGTYYIQLVINEDTTAVINLIPAN